MKFKYIFFLVLFILPMSCQDTLEDLNENPNQPEDVGAGELFTAGTRTLVNTSVLQSFLLGNNIAQLTAKTLRTEVDVYNWNSFPAVWEGFYQGLSNIVEAERIASENDNAKLRGAIMVIRTWGFSTLTDAYGDIPYTEALKGVETGDFSPVYDTQEEIYMGPEGLLATLEEAVTLLNGSGGISGDIIFNGDAAKWQKFANSLRLRLLMRISSKMDVSAEISQLVQGGNLMMGNDDSAVLEYLDGAPNQLPIVPLKQGDFDAVVLAENAYNTFMGYNDPRILEYARPDNLNLTNPVFSGATNGSENADICSKSGSRLALEYYDYPGHPATTQKADGVIMTYAEVELLLAEAAVKGYISANVEEHYRAGIAASMVHYNVDVEVFGYESFEDFYSNSGVAYNGDAMQIWEQQWLNSFFHGLEPYFMVRRWMYEVDFDWNQIPFLEPTCENQNDDQMPVRFLYPGEEQTLNSENYSVAVDRLGGNTQNAKMWLVQ